MAFKIPNFYAQNKKSAFAKGPEASSVPSPLNNRTKESPLRELITKRNNESVSTGKSVSYDEAYDAQSDEKKSNQSRAEFKKAAEKYNMDNYGTTEPTKAAEDGKLTNKQVEALKKSKKVNAKKDVDKKTDVKPEVKPEVKADVDPVKPKGKKRAKRAARIEKRKQKKEGIQAVKDSGLKGKEKREAKRAVRKKVGKTKVGKFLKSAKDAVVGDALGNDVKKDSPAKALGGKLDDVMVSANKTRTEHRLRKTDKKIDKASGNKKARLEKRATRLEKKVTRQEDKDKKKYINKKGKSDRMKKK